MKKPVFLLVMITTVFMAHAQSTRGESLYIIFPPNSTDLSELSQEQTLENMQVLTRVSQLLLRNPQYRILVDGHANPIVRTDREEEETLRPLSLRRAEIAADLLVQVFNVDRNRLILTGAGGGYPADRQNQALNRRVNFFIIAPR